MVTSEPHPSVNVKVRRREARQFGLQHMQPSKICLNHEDPGVQPATMLQERPEKTAGFVEGCKVHEAPHKKQGASGRNFVSNTNFFIAHAIFGYGTKVAGCLAKPAHVNRLNAPCGIKGQGSPKFASVQKEWSQQPPQLHES